VGSNSGRGKSRRSFRHPGALAALLVALVASACALPGSALAIEFRSKVDSFGPDGNTGSTFAFPGPLAFDQGTKHLYALDQGAQQIFGFDASTPGSHTELGGSFPLGAPGAEEQDDIAVDSSSHHIYYDNRSGKKVYGFDESGNTLSGFPLVGVPPFTSPCGVTVDSFGNVLVANRLNHSVTEYSSAGTYLEPYTLGTSFPCRIALDSAGNLFVVESPGSTVEYTAASGYNIASRKVIDPGAAFAIAVDHSTDEIYVVHEESISVYDDSGAFLYEFGAGGFYASEFGGIAIDEASEEVYVTDFLSFEIDVFGPPLSLPKLATAPASGVTATEATVNGTVNPRGLALEECHFEVIPAEQFIKTKYENVTPAEKFPCVPSPGSIPVDSNPHAVSAAVTGLNPASVYHYRLVAKNTVGEAKSLDAQLTTGPAAPLVEEASVEAVGTNEATVTAKINPRGGQTTYHLEYGTTNAYGQSTAESAPFGFASDNGKHPVSVHIGGLAPGTAYHFRFVASNEISATNGADATFATYPGTAQTFAPCPNDQFRTGAGSRLPDCRAYEQGTPIEKHSANPQGDFGQLSVSASGDRFTFLVTGGLPTSGGSSALTPFLASRGPGGWSTDGLLPPTQPGFEAKILGADEDLSTALVTGEGPGGVGEQLFLRDSDTAAFQPGPVLPSRSFPELIGFAADSNHLIFTSEKQLLPSALEGKTNLYDLDHGALTLVDRIPAGSAIGCDDEAGPACVVPPQGSGRITSSSTISRDGRAFFTARPSESSEGSGRIYLREDGTRTTWISASQRTTPDPGGEKPAELLGITPDGSKAFFTSCEKLTDDSTAVSNGENSCTKVGQIFVPGSGFKFVDFQGQDLYSYDVETGELTDLTVDSNADPLGAEVQGMVGASEDGSYVYFAADGALAAGASHGDCLFGNSFNGVNGACSLYVYHDGVTTFIARLSKGSGAPDWEGGQSAVSADGKALLFRADESLTGYNNIGGCVNGDIIIPCREFFRYSAPEEELLCLTCLPTGLPPSGGPLLGSNVTGHSFGTGILSRPRNLSADGNRFFFNSPDALVAGDTNHVDDVYEWEAKGEGSCESESQDGGCIYLISGGTDPHGSGFIDASANGEHAFFFTEQQLVPGDEDQLFDVYDAGVGAGLAAQHALAPPSCASTACQANPPPPPDQTLGSASFSGPGNAHKAPAARKCPKGKRKVRSAGKVRCQKAHKQHKRHNNRGGSK
jgi:hypothetical protein